MTRIGVITCQNISMVCAGLNCLRALSSHLGTFARYVGDIEIVGFTTCGGCPGHLAKKKAESMVRYGGAEKIHLGCCIFGSRPNPNKSLQEINTERAGRPITRLHQDDYAVEIANMIKSGQLPQVCYFKGKMKKDIEMLGVEVIRGTHTRYGPWDESRDEEAEV